jgi:CRP-like cAMP-binding protein
VNFTEPLSDKIIAHFKPLKVKRNTRLLHEGEVCKELYYVHKGCLRTYFIDKDGTEKTSAAILDNNTGTAWTSFISQQPSIEFIEATEDSELLTISHTEFYRLTKKDIAWKDFYLQSLEHAYLNQGRKIEALMTLNAQQRYQKLLKGNPRLIQRLSNKTLASFLHMREETLSRIKSKK